MPDFLKAFGLPRLAAMSAVAAGLAGFFLYVVTVMSSPPMSLLYSGLDPRDSAEIVAKLDARNVPYELRGDGTTVMVPEDKVLNLRMEMAGEGLPSGGSVGYEIFDQQDALGATAFVQSVNHLRALEGELARTIRALDPIDQARVHLVIPERELFARDKKEPTASIVVKARGRLNGEQVAAIQHLVASAVPGMSANRVSVIDEKGVLLGGGAAAGEVNPAIAIEDRQTAIEDRLRQQVEQIVGSVVGPGRARVQVSAEVDFSRVTSNSESFDPDGQVVRSTQTVSSNSASSNRSGANQGVSVGNALPGAQTATGESGQSENEARTEETVNYEISRTTTTEVQEAGRVTRLSVAVAVDGRAEPGADGQPGEWTPRPEQEIQQIATLVKSAIGFDEKRGDRVEVVNMRFAPVDVPEAGTAPDEGVFGFMPAQLVRLAEVLILSILALLVALFVVRPMISSLFALPQTVRLAGQTALPVADGAPQLAGPQAGAPAQAQLGQSFAPGALPAPRSETEQMIDIGRVQGQVKESSVRKVGEVVQNHPEEAISILRTWMHAPS